MYHMAGIHEWPGFESFSALEHEALTNEQRRNKVWLPVGSPAHNALKKVAWKPKLLKDILLLADFVQTSGLDVFHGTMVKTFLPKSHHSSYNGMQCHTQQAIIDNNCNARREVATTEAGEAQFKCVYPKLQKKKSYQFIDDLLRDTTLLKEGAINVPPLQRPVLPANIAPTPRGNKQDIIKQYQGHNLIPKLKLTQEIRVVYGNLIYSFKNKTQQKDNDLESHEWRKTSAST